MPINRLSSLVNELSKLPDAELICDVRETTKLLQRALRDGYKHWVIAFSGGKDSSLVAVLVAELLYRQTIRDVQVDLVFSDTLMELPPFGENAIALLNHIAEFSAKKSCLSERTLLSHPLSIGFGLLFWGRAMLRLEG